MCNNQICSMNEITNSNIQNSKYSPPSTWCIAHPNCYWSWRTCPHIAQPSSWNQNLTFAEVQWCAASGLTTYRHSAGVTNEISTTQASEAPIHSILYSIFFTRRTSSFPWSAAAMDDKTHRSGMLHLGVAAFSFVLCRTGARCWLHSSETIVYHKIFVFFFKGCFGHDFSNC